MAVHYLKTWPSYFQAIKAGDKPFEVRRNDRDYQPGDTLILQEWDPRKGGGVYTGDWLGFKAGWIVYGGAEEFGADAISPLYCVIGLAPFPEAVPDQVHPAVARRLGLLEAAE